MCTEKHSSLARLVCVLLFLIGIFLPAGLCQNAEPRGAFGTRSVARGIDSTQDETQLRERSRSWDASPEGKKTLDENRRALSSVNVAEAAETEAEAPPEADGNKNSVLPPSEGAANSSLRPGLNVTTASTARRKGSTGARKKRRRNKEARLAGLYDRLHRMTDDVRANEIKDRRRPISDKRGNLSSRRSKDPQARKLRAERRRRRKNRKRDRKRTRQNEGKENEQERRTSKFKRRMHDAPAALLLKLDEGNVSGSSLENSTISRINNTAKTELSLDSLNVPSLGVTEEISERPPQTTLRGIYADTVEREFSKKLEKEITRSRMVDSSSLESRILGSVLKTSIHRDAFHRDTKENVNEVVGTSEDKTNFGNSRYDAEKMLGYSRTEEDLPILDLENEVLARTLKDYNAYMTSSLKLSTLPRRNEGPDRGPSSASSRFHGKPIINERNGEEEEEETRRSAEVTTGESYDEDNTKGDLSCINGTFLPAPLARHALIKYVKSSVPRHEYLEADYECAPGFTMVSTASRLLCRNRQWVGQVPRCKLKQNPLGLCAEASCEHVCKEVDGKAVCSCYKGFQLEEDRCVDANECEENNGGCEYKCINTPGSFRCECPKGMRQGEDRFSCMDINECLLNNGHGPCQDTCRNLVGGYECSCEGLQDTVLSPDNHTCQDAGPCSVNNAGCSHTCLSTMGRVFCLCPDGFMLEDDWKTCQDVDECAVPDLQTEVCHHGCINTPGSYRCAEPMELKDQPILDTLSITCLPGYEATSDGTCIDINECTVENGGCTEVCENTDGSFFCACDGDEKALSSDGKSCVDINNVACPPLNPAGRGYLMCSRLAAPKPWRGRRRIVNRPGTKCFLKCPHGYQLHGEYELSCRSDGTWDGPKHGECVRYSKPRLECPKDVIAELPPGRDEAFVTFDQPSTDLDWFRYVRSKPSWGTRLEANLKPGIHEVAFFARHPVSKKQTNCVLRIVVKGGEAPKVKDCPKDIEVTGKNGTTIVWNEPIFTDNVKVTRISSNESPGRPFDIGGHKIEYEASDEAGWSSKCVFTVVLRQE